MAEADSPSTFADADGRSSASLCRFWRVRLLTVGIVDLMLFALFAELEHGSSRLLKLESGVIHVSGLYLQD